MIFLFKLWEISSSQLKRSSILCMRWCNNPKSKKWICDMSSNNLELWFWRIIRTFSSHFYRISKQTKSTKLLKRTAFCFRFMLHSSWIWHSTSHSTWLKCNWLTLCKKAMVNHKYSRIWQLSNSVENFPSKEFRNNFTSTIRRAKLPKQLILWWILHTGPLKSLESTG